MEVPTVLSVAVLQQRTAEQVIGCPVPGRGGGARGGLQGLSQGQGSTAVSGAEYVDTPVPHGRGRLVGGGLQGLSQGQGSTAVSGAEYVDTPVPHGRGRLVGGGLHGLSQGQGSTALCGADHVDIPVPHGRVGERGLQGLPKDRVPQRLLFNRPSFLLVEVFKGFPQGQGSAASAGEQTIVVDRLQGFPRGQGSTASAVEQTIVPARGGL